MAFTASQVEVMAKWCATSPELATERAAARRAFFGEDDARRARYWPVAQDLVTRDRRFLGWFMFSCRLPDGRMPAELAVDQQPISQREGVLRAIRGHRYVLATVGTVLSGSVFLDLEEEHFEVRQRS